MLLTIPQTAARLAISTRQTYRLIDTGALPVVELGERCYRIRPEDVDALIKRNLTNRVTQCQYIGTKQSPAGASKSRTMDDALESLLRPAPARPRRSSGKPRLEIVSGKAS
jgi:excisionase family DNA binding protein